MADLRKLKDKAAELAARGKVEKAADVYREILEADPKDVGVRQKLAEVLRRAGEIPEAVVRYGEVAERFARDGLLIKAIAICKTILELDPQHGATQALLADLYGKRAAAEGARPPPRTMMALRAVALPPPAREPTEELVVERGVSLPLTPAPQRPDALELPPELQPVEEEVSEDVPLGLDEAEAAPPAATAPLPAAPPEGSPRPPRRATETGFFRIMAAAEQAVAAGVDDRIHVDPDLDEDAGPSPGDEPAAVEIEVALPELPDDAIEPVPAPPPPAAARLPHVPIFSDLGREAFVALTEGMVLHRVAAGQPVLREGETGASLYVVAAGRFAVTKLGPDGAPALLAHLGEGDFFGEMALLSGAPRAATVTAEAPGEVLELPAAVLQAVAGRHPHLADSLRRFYRQRLLANAMAVSPIFRPFGRGERKAIIERFHSREVQAGDALVREGERSDGLYVILDGAMDVLKRRGGEQVLAGQLREGDLFGEVSCLRKSPATATVVARRRGTVLRLPRSDFDALVMTYPQILELVSSLSDERLESLDAILSGHAEYTEEGLVLI